MPPTLYILFIARSSLATKQIIANFTVFHGHSVVIEASLPNSAVTRHNADLNNIPRTTSGEQLAQRAKFLIALDNQVRVAVDQTQR